VRRGLSVLLLIVPGQIHYQADIGRTLQKFFQDGGFKNDVAVEEEASALHLIFGTEE